MILAPRPDERICTVRARPGFGWVSAMSVEGISEYAEEWRLTGRPASARSSCRLSVGIVERYEFERGNPHQIRWKDNPERALLHQIDGKPWEVCVRRSFDCRRASISLSIAGKHVVTNSFDFARPLPGARFVFEFFNQAEATISAPIL